MLSGTLMSLDAPSTPYYPWIYVDDLKPIKVFSILHGVIYDPYLKPGGI